MSLTVFEEFKSNFQNELKNTPNKKNLVDNEISEIDKFLEPRVNYPSPNPLAGGSGAIPERISYHVFKIDISNASRNIL